MTDQFAALYGHHFHPDLLKEIEGAPIPKSLKAKSVLLNKGDYIRSMPFVMNGSIKTLRRDTDGHELLLYFINPGETCAMTLSCCLGHHESEIKAVAETDIDLLTVPVQKMEAWSSRYKSWRRFVFDSYHNQLLRSFQTIDRMAFSKLDQRLWAYLKAQCQINGRSSLKITHQEIANDLNSSRVMISRLLKKLENQNRLTIKHNCIEVKSL